jgi:cytochrome c551/c552
MIRMTHKRVHWRLIAIMSALLATLTLAACTPDAGEFIISPNLAQQVAARDAGEVVQAIAAPTPKKLAELSEEEQLAGLPDDVRNELANVNIADADALITQYGCIGCHGIEKDKTYTGPTWYSAGNIAVNRRPDESPALYLYESIANPNAYVVEGFNSGIMPVNFKERMSAKEFATLVSYLLSQTQE